MNTRLIYKLTIKSAIPGTSTVYIVNARLEEEDYKFFLKKLEDSRFITVVDTNQNPVTINTEFIYKVETEIGMESYEAIIEEE